MDGADCNFVAALPDTLPDFGASFAFFESDSQIIPPCCIECNATIFKGENLR